MSGRKRHFRKLNGILLLDKALGVSSNKALQDARYLFQAEKAGHTGSLDPLASGMLPVCFGEATKVSGFLLDSDKSYITEAHLGFNSSTGDAEGQKVAVAEVPLLNAEILDQILKPFRGSIQQIPPMYSALKKDGQPLYKWARQGIDVERAARSVHIHTLRLVDFSVDRLLLEVCCSKGTYIRSLVEDIGAALACGAYVSMLRRTVVSPFQGQRMYTLAALHALAEQGQEALDAVLLPVDAALPHLAALHLQEAQVLKIRQGQRLNVSAAEGIVRLYENHTQQFIGLGECQAGVLRAKRLLAYY
ncbi:MAG: tRNA pseudouridine(55) synthase TruB [Proteobacteria bacterium]|nr:MAG: tRNA pseudouridine(55) synthase TruB [Pseudomonadota bacterium]